MGILAHVFVSRASRPVPSAQPAPALSTGGLSSSSLVLVLDGIRFRAALFGYDDCSRTDAHPRPPRNFVQSQFPSSTRTKDQDEFSSFTQYSNTPVLHHSIALSPAYATTSFLADARRARSRVQSRAPFTSAAARS
jgi:hypothetical protein